MKQNIKTNVPYPHIYGQLEVGLTDDDGCSLSIVNGKLVRQGQYQKLFDKFNQIQYSWGHIAARCIGHGNSAYRVAAMYLEYENVASPGDPVSIPTFGRDEGISYYDDLVSSGSRDFLRVALQQQPLISIASGFEAFFTDNVDGNQLTFYSQSAGVAGIHGKAFTNGANSKIFGAALVATPVFADRTQDVILARTYFLTADQTVKSASSQIAVTWATIFE